MERHRGHMLPGWYLPALPGPLLPHPAHHHHGQILLPVKLRMGRLLGKLRLCSFPGNYSTQPSMPLASETPSMPDRCARAQGCGVLPV